MKRLLFYVDDDSKICQCFREYAIYRGYACHCYHESESALKGIVRNREGTSRSRIKTPDLARFSST